MLNFVKIAVSELENRKIIEKPKIYSFLVHWNIRKYPHPFRLQEKEQLYPPKELVNSYSWKIYQLSEKTEKMKKEGINQFKSQLISPYLNFLMQGFIRTNELFCEI
jgi:hypothetical protein